jgi:apolipoprotein D and lipocalin family protein
MSGVAVLLLSGCVGVPEGVEPVTGLDRDRYLGKWYEIARLDHRFERGMTHVSATYTAREDGGIDVLNRGYGMPEERWSEATGKAYSVGEPDVGHLKVSFFGPFYGSYVIFELDEAYTYAFVCGPNTDYLWLLARTPEVSSELQEHFTERVRQLGFDADGLIWVDQRQPLPLADASE